MGNRSIIYKYPLDLTGTHPNNLVVGEPHTLGEGDNRAVVPNYGAFYSKSLMVRDADTGTVLVPYEDFDAVHLYQDVTLQTGLEVCGAFLIKNATINAIEIDYQVVGERYSHTVTGLRELIETLDLDERPVSWGDLLGKPTQYPCAPHLHNAGDLYGFEFLVEALDRLRDAVLLGDKAAFTELRQYIELLEEEVRHKIKEFEYHENNLREYFRYWIHKDSQNSHGVNKYQLGLPYVDDKPLLTLKHCIDEFIFETNKWT